MVLGFFGCFLQPTAANDLAGSYRAEYEFGFSRVTLHSNGTFDQELRANGQKLATEGTWTYAEANHRITLQGAIFPDDGYGQLKADGRPFEPGTVSLPVERDLLGRIRLGPDEGSFYRQVRRE